MRLRSVAAITAVVVLSGGSAHAGVSSTSIDRLAARFAGRQVWGGGTISCTSGDVAKLRLTVSQGGEADAKGGARLPCTGATQRWDIKAMTLSAALFQPGSAQTCLTATTKRGPRVTGSKTTCRALAVVEP